MFTFFVYMSKKTKNVSNVTKKEYSTACKKKAMEASLVFFPLAFFSIFFLFSSCCRSSGDRFFSSELIAVVRAKFHPVYFIYTKRTESQFFIPEKDGISDVAGHNVSKGAGFA